MNKTEFVDELKKRCDSDISTKAAAERITAAVLDIIQDTMVKGDQLAFPGFGTFKVVERAPRTGRNPATGEEMQIAGGRSAKFQAGSKFKDALKK